MTWDFVKRQLNPNYDNTHFLFTAFGNLCVHMNPFLAIFHLNNCTFTNVEKNSNNNHTCKNYNFSINILMIIVVNLTFLTNLRVGSNI